MAMFKCNFELQFFSVSKNAFLLFFHMEKLYYISQLKVLRLSQADVETCSWETGPASGGRSALDTPVT